MIATALRLLPEQALAKRWLRLHFVPLDVWRWLAGRAPSPKLSHWSPAPEVRKRLSALGQPLVSQHNAHERDALDRTLSLSASLMAHIHTKSRGPALACQERMLATCLLPLYRGLASGSIEEVTSVMLRQLADSLALCAVISEFESELPERLATTTARTDESPTKTLKPLLGISLETLSQHLLLAAQSWSGTDEHELFDLVDTEISSVKRPAWGTPEILWRLAGELIADRSEFVVPRDWVKVPVPWSDASEHWRGICQALRECDPTSESPDNTAQQLRNDDDEIARLKLEIEIADSIDSLVQRKRSASRRQPSKSNSETAPAPRFAQDDFLLPKTIIAEVRSHNDPAFVSVVRRQLAVCRNEERGISLIAARVRLDGDGEGGDSDMTAATALKALGLSAWQQKLVNWISDHPEVHEPYAFVSNEGELILCLMDLERNTATSLVRQALVEVLTGRPIRDDGASALARVEVPARYHVGIGSVGAPTASFEAEQLIGATYRCLAAAERHGKASIKSIEVF